MNALVDHLLAVAWPDGVPQRLDGLIDRPLCTRHLADFKLGLVFPFDGSLRPVRLALSCQGERSAWRRGVAERWPAPALDDFFDHVPADTRLMVDSDGSDRAVVYLDDLQQVDHRLQAPAGLELMCWTLELPDGTDGFLTRHREPPHDRVPPGQQAHVQALLDAGAEGLWALRWRGDQPCAVLWVSESRWRANAATTCQIADQLGSHPGFRAALGCLAEQGHEGYPDVIELRADGGIEVTLGILTTPGAQP